MQTDPRIDTYIAGAADFARPILEHLRALAHGALPDGAEAVKWGMPHFTVAGKNVAGMAAFKAHCTFAVHGDGRQGEAMGQFGRLTTLSDLPSDEELTAKLRQARARVLEQGTAVPKRTARAPREDIAMPDDFAAALAALPAAQAVYNGFAPSARREYLEWIVEAKAAATRERRIAQAVAWIAEGKKRNWKYQKT